MQNDRNQTVAWAAGLFEGEGSWYARRCGDFVYARASLASTDEDVVRRFFAVVGCGAVHREADRPGRKPIWRWQVQSRVDFAAIADQLKPWLGTRRLQQLADVLAAQTAPVYRKRAKCLQGHPLEGHNVFIDYRGERRCRECRNAGKRRARERTAVTARPTEPGGLVHGPQ